MGVLIRRMQQVKYRLKVRKGLQEEPIELVKITYEECKRELERRNKK